MIELIIVIAIISILASIAAMNYQHSVWRAREAVLRNDLFTLRSSIDQYTLDKQKAPQSLAGPGGGGLHQGDPEGSDDEPDGPGSTEQEDSLMAIDQTKPGIVDVHSGIELVSTEGTAYNTW